jgi:transposase-like protein
LSDIMPQNATFSENLSPAQEKALAALLAGQTITDAAKAAEVDRSTIYRWLRDACRPDFRIALERGRLELRQAVEARLLALANEATDCLEHAFARGDGKSALALLHGLGLLPR